MNKTLFYSLCYICLISCREMTEFYTDQYQFSYARPIGLMMSQAFDSLNLTGKGVKIGVIDAGFGGFRTNKYTQNLTVKAYRDFISGDTTNFFSENESNHGTVVTEAIGGRNDKNLVHGLAFQSEYYLAKTDIENEEPHEDEVRLIRAIDWLLSQGVTLINISLGYTVFEDDQAYTNKMLDGKSARSSRYIDSLLQSRKDLIIVVSAGNEGDKDWKYLTFPADVKDAITVGSTDFDGLEGYRSSGRGVDYVDYIKPEVSTYPSPPGNSNTAPIITGLIACILEKEKLERNTLRQILIESASNFQSPDREIGYGVPSTKKILEKMQRYR